MARSRAQERPLHEDELLLEQPLFPKRVLQAVEQLPLRALPQVDDLLLVERHQP